MKKNRTHTGKTMDTGKYDTCMYCMNGQNVAYQGEHDHVLLHNRV
jgi:hypothetical protein